MTESTEPELHDAHAVPAADEPVDAHILPVVDDQLPEPTDNSVKEEDGEQDVDQSTEPTPGSPA